jgi:hypothetical protein
VQEVFESKVKTWKAMRVITDPDERRSQVRADDDGNMWLWEHANGKHVWAKRFTEFPYRNDLHRLMNTLCK